MNKENEGLLEEARRRYPIGSYVYSALKWDPRPIKVKVGQIGKVDVIKNRTIIWNITEDGVNLGFLYDDGNWATIIKSGAQEVKIKGETDLDLKNTCVWVATLEDSYKIQEKAFELGFAWVSSGTSLQKYVNRWFHFSPNMWISRDKTASIGAKQVYIEDLFPENTPVPAESKDINKEYLTKSKDLSDFKPGNIVVRTIGVSGSNNSNFNKGRIFVINKVMNGMLKEVKDGSSIFHEETSCRPATTLEILEYSSSAEININWNSYGQGYHSSQMGKKSPHKLIDCIGEGFFNKIITSNPTNLKSKKKGTKKISASKLPQSANLTTNKK